MTINIPDDVLDKHEEAVDAMLDKFGVSCLISFSPKMTPCNNCTLNPIGRKSSNIYKSGGPVPFSINSRCPVCGGEGFKQLINTASITLQIYWEPKQFVDIGAPIKLPGGIIQCKGYMTDIANLRLATEISVNIASNIGGKFRLWGEPIAHGFRNKRYFLAFLERIGG